MWALAGSSNTCPALCSMYFRVVIEQRDYADNGEIVVALIENFEATLKYIEQSAGQVLLLPANAHMSALSYRPEQVAIQGVLVGQMRSYRSH